jgi:hypothetical protein
MKRMKSLTFAALVFGSVLAVPSVQMRLYGQQATPTPTDSSAPSQDPIRGTPPKMVPARGLLAESVDGKKTAVGMTVHVKLDRKIKLQDGPELPKGTTLTGEVVSDELEAGGRSTLALRFEQAMLKTGEMVPVKVTILAVHAPAPPPSGTPSDDLDALVAVTDFTGWESGQVQVDQVDVMKGVDLHSAMTRRNSGVLVSNTDKDIKLGMNTQLELAIAFQPHGTQLSSR